MKWIKTTWYFLITLIGMSMIGFFGLLGICAVKGIFSYLFTHCSDLMWLLVGFMISLCGVVIGWNVFCNSADKLKDN